MTRPKELMLRYPSLVSSETSPYFNALMKAKKFVEVLLHQQLWFFGNDVKISNKNLLVNYGFDQIRPPKDISGSTNYVCKTGEATLVLWGFGVFLSERNNQGVYIGRYNFYPRLIKDELINFPVCATSNLPEMKYPKSVEEWEYCFRLISEFFEWIASYELWVNWIMGGSYRKTCLKVGTNQLFLVMKCHGHGIRSQNFLVRILNFMKNPKNIFFKIIGSTHNYEVIKTITNCLYKKCILL